MYPAFPEFRRLAPLRATQANRDTLASKAAVLKARANRAYQTTVQCLRNSSVFARLKSGRGQLYSKTLRDFGRIQRRARVLV